MRPLERPAIEKHRFLAAFVVWSFGASILADAAPAPKLTGLERIGELLLQKSHL